MNNLTTRKIVLGLLMALVLAFSVQSIADAALNLTKSSGDNQTRWHDLALLNPLVFTVSGVNNDDSTNVTPNQDPPDTIENSPETVTITVPAGATVTKLTIGSITVTQSSRLASSIVLTEENTDIGFPQSGIPLTDGTISIYCTLTTQGPKTFTITGRTNQTQIDDTIEFKAYSVATDSDALPTALAAATTTSPQIVRGGLFGPGFATMTVALGAEFLHRLVSFEVIGGGTHLSLLTESQATRSQITVPSNATGTAAVSVHLTGGHVKVRASVLYTELEREVIYFHNGYTLVKTSDNKQISNFNTKLANPFVVRLQDANNSAVSGQKIDFSIIDPVSGGELTSLGMFTRTSESDLTQIEVTTDSSGNASVFLELDSTAANHNVEATFGNKSVDFTATAQTAGAAASINIDDGDGQSAALDQSLTKALTVIVGDLGGRIVQNIPVTFTTDSGALSPPSSEDPGAHDPSTTPNTDRGIVIQTDETGKASVRYNVGDVPGGKNIYATINAYDGQTRRATFGINGAPSTGRPSTPETSTNTITISPSSTTGEPGEEVTIRVTSSPSGVFATLGSNDFGATRFSPQSDFTPFTSTLLLPVEEGTHSFFATGGVLTAGRASVTVEAELGELSITAIGPVAAGVQTFSITARDSDGDSAIGAFTARLSGTGFTSRNVEISGGRGNARVTLPTAASLYTLTVSATGYEDGETPVRIAGTGQQQVADEDEEEVEEEVTVAAEPDSIEITGPSTRSGTVNEELDTPLLVRVLDDDGDGLEGARVFYRVSSGRGRLSARGNGRAIGVVTDDDGYARASFTPLDGGTITVRANTDDLSATVTFTITTGSASSASGARDSGTGGTPGMISPVVHVGAASRPPMLWVDGGAIYALVGASPQRFAPGVDNALNITVGGGKVYWTEKTGESGGTINSANLNGSDVTELTSIKAVPMGIAVDVAGSQLYWTNSRGRIQSADLDGSGITNVMQNLPSPMDLALAGGNAYWTQGNGSVRFVNLRGQKVVRNVSTGTDTPGSLVIGGGKVYWTEMTGESGGTVNSANLNGTGATPLASILAAPMGIAVDGSRSKLYWSNSRGRIQSANLDGSGITNVVSGLGSPGDMVLSNSISAPAATTTTRTTTTTASNAKYDVNGDGVVDRFDALLVVSAFGTSNNKYDVNGDGTVNVKDYDLVFDNLAPGAAAAPAIVGMKFSAAQIDRIEEQIDLLIATNDRSPATLRTLIYLQQLLVTARPEKTQLLANYPNPFNPETWIPYELATDTHVRLTIYNTQGVVIRTLQLGHQSAGYYVGRDRAAYWDGRNALGEQVASGLYFYQLETDEMSLMRKMVILK